MHRHRLYTERVMIGNYKYQPFVHKKLWRTALKLQRRILDTVQVLMLWSTYYRSRNETGPVAGLHLQNMYRTAMLDVEIFHAHRFAVNSMNHLVRQGLANETGGGLMLRLGGPGGGVV
jgi:hypothetical protein